jgi:hypothetical protein
MKRERAEHSRGAVFVMGMMAVAGVLIWSKLRLATNIPRSAYAVPEQVEAPNDPGSAQPGADARVRPGEGWSPD